MLSRAKRRPKPRLNQLIDGSGLDHTIPPPPRLRSLRQHVVRRLKHEERTIRQCVQIQSRGERVAHLEKVTTERISARKFDAWDVHTDNRRTGDGRCAPRDHPGHVERASPRSRCAPAPLAAREILKGPEAPVAQLDRASDFEPDEVRRSIADRPLWSHAWARSARVSRALGRWKVLCRLTQSP